MLKHQEQALPNKTPKRGRREDPAEQDTSLTCTGSKSDMILITEIHRKSFQSCRAIQVQHVHLVS